MQKTTFPAVVATFVVSFAFWVLLTWSFTVQELIVGAVVSLGVALFSARFFIHEKAFWLCNPAKFFSGLFYWLCIFPVDLKSDYGQAALANSITLTPGTITMDITEEEGQTYYYIHWIDVTAPSGKEAGDAIKGTLEKGLRRVWE